MPLGFRVCGFVRPEGVRARPTQPRRIGPIHRNVRTPLGRTDCPVTQSRGHGPQADRVHPFGAR